MPNVRTDSVDVNISGRDDEITIEIDRLAEYAIDGVFFYVRGGKPIKKFLEVKNDNTLHCTLSASRSGYHVKIMAEKKPGVDTEIPPELLPPRFLQAGEELAWTVFEGDEPFKADPRNDGEAYRFGWDILFLNNS